MKYRLLIGKHYRFEDGLLVRLEAGDVFEPSEVELEAFGDRLEAVEEAADLETTDPAPKESDSEQNSGADQGNLLQTPLTNDPTGLEIETVPGIGPKTAEVLRAAGIMTVLDLARVANGPELAEIVGASQAAKIRKALMDLNPAGEVGPEGES